jgi:hypothetical protein
MRILSIEFIELGNVVERVDSESSAFFWLTGRFPKNNQEYRAEISVWRSVPGREIARHECMISEERTGLTDERLFLLDNGLGH